MKFRRSKPPEERLTQEEYDSSRCMHCGGVHLRACPRVKRMVFSPNGVDLLEIEFWETYDDTNIIWPESIWEDTQDEIE